MFIGHCLADHLDIVRSVEGQNDRQMICQMKTQAQSQAYGQRAPNLPSFASASTRLPRKTLTSPPWCEGVQNSLSIFSSDFEPQKLLVSNSCKVPPSQKQLQAKRKKNPGFRIFPLLNYESESERKSLGFYFYS